MNKHEDVTRWLLHEVSEHNKQNETAHNKYSQDIETNKSSVTTNTTDIQTLKDKQTEFATKDYVYESIIHQGDGASYYEARRLKFYIRDNHTANGAISVSHIGFYYKGVEVPYESSWNCTATTSYQNKGPENAFSGVDEGWSAAYAKKSHQVLVVDTIQPILFDEIRVKNYYYEVSKARGIRRVKVSIAPDTSTTWDDVPTGDVIFDGIVPIYDPVYGLRTILKLKSYIAVQDGDVVGPAVATPNALAAYDGATGRLLKDSILSVVGPYTLKVNHATHLRIGTNSVMDMLGSNGTYTYIHAPEYGSSNAGVGIHVTKDHTRLTGQQQSPNDLNIATEKFVKTAVDAVVIPDMSGFALKTGSSGQVFSVKDSTVGAHAVSNSRLTTYTEAFTTSEKNKLSKIATEANKYVLPSDVVKDSSYVHTDKNFTSALHLSLTKLGSLVGTSATNNVWIQQRDTQQNISMNAKRVYLKEQQPSRDDLNIATEKYVDEKVSGIGSGDVKGPASSNSGGLAVFDGTTGKAIKGATPITASGSIINNPTGSIHIQAKHKHRVVIDNTSTTLYSPSQVQQLILKNYDATLKTQMTTRNDLNIATEGYVNGKVAEGSSADVPWQTRYLGVYIKSPWKADDMYMSIRNISFYRKGVRVPYTSAWKASTNSLMPSGGFTPIKAFDNTPLTGPTMDNSYSSNRESAQNVSLVLDTGSIIEFDEVRITNGHSDGTLTDRGAKDVQMFIGTAPMTTVYASRAGTLLFDGVFPEYSPETHDQPILKLPDPGVSIVSQNGIAVLTALNNGSVSFMSTPTEHSARYVATEGFVADSIAASANTLVNGTRSVMLGSNGVLLTKALQPTSNPDALLPRSQIQDLVGMSSAFVRTADIPMHGESDHTLTVPTMSTYAYAYELSNFTSVKPKAGGELHLDITPSIDPVYMSITLIYEDAPTGVYTGEEHAIKVHPAPGISIKWGKHPTNTTVSSITCTIPDNPRTAVKGVYIHNHSSVSRTYSNIRMDYVKASTLLGNIHGARDTGVGLIMADTDVRMNNRSKRGTLTDDSILCKGDITGLSAGMSQQDGDLRYAHITGNTGKTFYCANATQPTHAVNRIFGDSRYARRAGGAGIAFHCGDATHNNHAVSRQFGDSRYMVGPSGAGNGYLALFDGTTGKKLKKSHWHIDSGGAIYTTRGGATLGFHKSVSNNPETVPVTAFEATMAGTTLYNGAGSQTLLVSGGNVKLGEQNMHSGDLCVATEKFVNDRSWKLMHKSFWSATGLFSSHTMGAFGSPMPFVKEREYRIVFTASVSGRHTNVGTIDVGGAEAVGVRKIRTIEGYLSNNASTGNASINERNSVINSASDVQFSDTIEGAVKYRTSVAAEFRFKPMFEGETCYNWWMESTAVVRATDQPGGGMTITNVSATYDVSAIARFTIYSGFGQSASGLKRKCSVYSRPYLT